MYRIVCGNVFNTFQKLTLQLVLHFNSNSSPEFVNFLNDLSTLRQLLRVPYSLVNPKVNLVKLFIFYFCLNIVTTLSLGKVFSCCQLVDQRCSSLSIRIFTRILNTRIEKDNKTLKELRALILVECYL